MSKRIDNVNSSNEKERIGILVSKKLKKEWSDFSEEFNIPTLSKLIREGVNNYIEAKHRGISLADLTELSHTLKEPLTTIKGFSQLIIEEFSDKLDIEILFRIKEIYDQSLFLENKINEYFIDSESKPNEYDILIVDDDKNTNLILSRYFQIRGYKSYSVRTGSEALETLRRFTPKLILLDIILPDINGYKICEEIKANKKYRDIPVYYITAIPKAEVEKKIDETGANGFFLKPFDFSEMKAIFSQI
ncbi:MAG: response regulator [Candidatus Lokiarchaeota archaeon]|nr:response regulator [Candidatus Lokiarchaeota archaeon]